MISSTVGARAALPRTVTCASPTRSRYRAIVVELQENASQQPRRPQAQIGGSPDPIRHDGTAGAQPGGLLTSPGAPRTARARAPARRPPPAGAAASPGDRTRAIAPSAAPPAGPERQQPQERLEVQVVGSHGRPGQGRRGGQDSGQAHRELPCRQAVGPKRAAARTGASVAPTRPRPGLRDATGTGRSGSLPSSSGRPLTGSGIRRHVDPRPDP